MIIIIYSVCPIFTNPPDWWKALSNGVKTHLFKLKTSKTFQRGFCHHCTPPPRSRSGLRPERDTTSLPLKSHFIADLALLWYYRVKIHTRKIIPKTYETYYRVFSAQGWEEEMHKTFLEGGGGKLCALPTQFFAPSFFVHYKAGASF